MVAELKAIEPYIAEPSVGAETGAVRVEEPALLGRMLSALLDDMLPALLGGMLLISLLGSLSLRESTDFDDTDFNMEQ